MVGKPFCQQVVDGRLNSVQFYWEMILHGALRNLGDFGDFGHSGAFVAKFNDGLERCDDYSVAC